MKLTALSSLLLVVALTTRADTKVVLPDTQRFAETGKDFLVETTVPGDFKSLDAIILALLTLSPQNPKHLSTPFFPDAVGETKEPLYHFFRGVRQKGSKITLRFSGGAMRYLNSAISLQEMIKGALEGTIKLHARECKTIEYEGDDQVVEDWDA